jgi:methylase of polypeptide subunit release factors
VVDYLVRRTLGPLLAEQPPGAAPITVLDPACGSGLFLLGAYQYLLDWYGAQVVAPLSRAARLRILRLHIYGVDIDPRAVAVARLSLGRLVLAGGAAPLPDLRANIQCGDALIGPDFAGATPATPTPDTVRVFDWAAAFPTIMQAGGFDVVLGNPPYVSYSGRQAIRLAASQRRYLFATYAGARWPAAHAFFIERAVRTLARRVTAFIVPDQVGHLAGYAGVRALVTGHSRLVEVRYWGEGVFPDAITPALTFVADTQYTGEAAIFDRDGARHTRACRGGHPWRAAPGDALLEKLLTAGASLGALVADPGVHTGNCAAALVYAAATAPPGSVPVLEGRQIGRYTCAPPDKRLRLDYRPAAGEYFSIRPEARYAAAPFVIRQTAGYPIVGPRRHATYFRNSLLALYPPTDGRDVRYLVALLNSTLLRYVYRRLVQEAGQKAFPQVKVGSLRQLPIYPLDLADPADAARHAMLVTLVSHMLALYEQTAGTPDAAEQAAIRQALATTDAQIDQQVYALYGLTEAEIALVQAGAAP